MRLKFYECSRCGNVAIKIVSSTMPLECCGEEMNCLVPHTEDEGAEKHVPQVSIDGTKVIVTVSSVIHPSSEDHYIQYIVLETTEGFKVKYLLPGDKPKVTFCLCDCETFVAAYDYCNIHGLWMTKLCRVL